MSLPVSSFSPYRFTGAAAGVVAVDARRSRGKERRNGHGAGHRSSGHHVEIGGTLALAGDVRQLYVAHIDDPGQSAELGKEIQN